MSGQNLLEYLETLQLEYFSYLFRTKIYELPHYIKMAQDIANLKEEKNTGNWRAFWCKAYIY